jgi:hypothetical protein
VWAHARMCFWDSTHLHACFHSPNSSMETRQNPAEMLNPGTARTPSPPNRIQKIEHKSRSNSPLDFFFLTPGSKNRLPPNQSNGIAPRRETTAASSSRTRQEPPHPTRPGTRVHRIEP